MMIRFNEGEKVFNYRIVGVTVHEDAVLLHQAEGENFWTFPGGRAEFGETAEQTLIREMREEIGAEVEVVRLLWFVENFFTYTGQQFHEIALYFLMRFSPMSAHLLQANSFQGHEEGLQLTYRWFPRRAEVLAGLPLLPAFLQTGLQDLPESMQHIVEDDGEID